MGHKQIVNRFDCEAAIVRTYDEMRLRGVIEADAMRAALRVFRFHEPALPLELAESIVKAWMTDRKVATN